MDATNGGTTTHDPHPIPDSHTFIHQGLGFRGVRKPDVGALHATMAPSKRPPSLAPALSTPCLTTRSSSPTMSSEVCDNTEERSVDKGKARADPSEWTERTPLLGTTSGSFSPHPVALSGPTPPHRQSLLAKLLSVFLVSLSLCIIAFVFVALILYSYASRTSGLSPQDLVQRALALQGPDRLDVLNITKSGDIWLRIDGKLGLDAGAAIGVNTQDSDSVLSDLWKSIGRWSIHRLDRISVNTTLIRISSANGDILANISVPPLELPLTTNPPQDQTWLTPLSLPVLLQPTKDIGTLIRFATDSWRNGFVTVFASVNQTVVTGGQVGETGWRKFIRVVRSDVSSVVTIKIPPLPGLPTPGRSSPFPNLATLVTLQAFLITSDESSLSITASATAINPLPPTIRSTVPALPFVVSLPTNDSEVGVPIASVQSFPLSLTHPNISISLTGQVLPLSSSSSPYLSEFLSSYVSAISPPILISTPLLPNITYPSVFPAPVPKPEILRNVTIKDMKIKPTANGSMLASGIVQANVVLPKGIHVGLEVGRVYPDVLVFDGEVPESEMSTQGFKKPKERSGLPPDHPLPDPLPERAFAHIKPDDWLVADSSPLEGNEDDGSTVEVSARIVDVPLQVLPGRDREFRSFVGKVIFGSQGALAGVQGVAAVGVRIQGMPFEHGNGRDMELDGLPFQGSVRIGKKSL